MYMYRETSDKQRAASRASYRKNSDKRRASSRRSSLIRYWKDPETKKGVLLCPFVGDRLHYTKKYILGNKHYYWRVWTCKTVFQWCHAILLVLSHSSCHYTFISLFDSLLLPFTRCFCSFHSLFTLLVFIITSQSRSSRHSLCIFALLTH